MLPRADGVTPLHLQGVQVSDVPGQSIPLLTQDATLSISACLGDFDGDGDVDIVDLQRIAFRWNIHCGDSLYDPIYDLDGDCDIDILDVQQVAYRWGTQCWGVSKSAVSSRAPQQEAVLAVLPPTRTVQVGQTFTVGVVITDAVDMGAFEFTMAYTPTVVEVVTATLGSFPGSTGRSVVPAAPVISSTAGTVAFGAYSLGRTPEGPSGDGVLVTLTLRALAEGESGLDFISAQIGDRAGTPQALGDLIGGQIAVTSSSRWWVYLPLTVDNYP